MPSTPTAHPALTIRLPFDAPHRTAASISKLASDFFCAVESDPEMGARVHMVAQELTENVLKYSVEGETTLEIAIELGPAGRRVRMTARNRASQDKIDDVMGRVAELEHASDPVHVYDRLIRESAPRRGVSGLGLARIRAEGGFSLSCSATDGELVVVAAHGLDGERR